MSSQAWSVLHEGLVLVGSPDHAALPYLEAADVSVEVVSQSSPRALAERLVAEAAEHGVVVWLVAGDGDPDLGLALPAAVAAAPTPPELEMLPGSYDLPGAALLDLVAVMDRLRSPGGCPWDAKQTHESLVTYLVEETYETIEAIETGDRDHLREELGDLLLQVVFHARIAAEDRESPWSIDDVAADIVAKLVRRHPHVFADVHAPTAEHVEANWEVLKAAEKGRESAVDGVPTGLPALALAAKLMSRAAKAGVPVSADPDDSSFGGRLLRLVAEAQAAGADAEAELRAAARRYADAVRAAESGRTP
jgi:XTP/dITP diphosphohydrolase